MMKFFLFCFLSAWSLSSLFAQVDSLSMTAVGRWDNEALPDANYGDTPFSYAGCFGFAKDGHEYALLGSSSAVHVLDITDPTNVVEKGVFPGGSTTVWREVAVYENYAYCISDNTQEGLIILDLSQLPDTVTKVSQTTTFFAQSHTIFADEPNGRLYFMGSWNNNIIILDVATDPANPTLLFSGPLAGGTLHDMYVKDNIGYGCHGNNGLFIYDFTDATNPVLKASMTTNGYCHSAWTTEDGNHLLVADEVPTGLPLLMVDISNYENNDISIVAQFSFPLIEGGSQSVTYHNPYISGNYAYVSSYMDGLQVFDVSDPLNPAPYAHYDTYANTVYDGYDGCWGAFIGLPSGRILASDIQGGLYVVQYDSTISSLKPVVLAQPLSVFPNPVEEYLQITLPDDMSSGKATFRILNALGEVVLQGNTANQEPIKTSGLPAGTYLVQIQHGTKMYSSKFVKL